MTEPTFCVANINRAGKRRRTALGVLALVGTLGTHFVWPPEPGSFRLILELPMLVFGWLCVMQAAAGT